MEQRPNPEELLQRVQEEEREQQRGKLKIYLGAAPGVGKTYTMLQDALEKRTQGLDVVVGVAESHGRNEIEALLKNFEKIPLQTVEYRDKQIPEFDLDAALKRNPGLILMDEMAHTNMQGLRHKKRWQDIKELLDRGTDVYTTLNIQHIESINDIVSQIVQFRIKETVPDSMLEQAHSVELVDLPPEDLLKRLQEGKVYFPEQAQLAKEHFFRKGNLIALRDLALRVTAECVEAQVLSYRQGQGIKQIWPTKEKILACVGPGSDSIKVIRTARRMAASLTAEWCAIHVDAPKLRLSEEEHNRAIQNLRLAEQLGAETRIIIGFDIVKEIMDFAREKNITRIVIWKKTQSRWKDFLFNSLADAVVRASLEIDVHIITGEVEPIHPKPMAPTKKKTPWRIYTISIGIVALATGIDFVLFSIFKSPNLIMVYLLGVTLVAMLGEMRAGILASLLSVLAYDFFFVPPTFTFSIPDIQYLVTLLMMLFVTLIVTNLTILKGRQADLARLAESHTAALYTLSRQLAVIRGVDQILEIAVRYIAEVFDSQVLALLPQNSHLAIRAGYRAELILNTKEQSVAQWVYDVGQIAGLGTDTLPFSEALYVPLLASEGSTGVLRIRPIQTGHLFTPEQMRLLEACANQIALALEVDRLHEQSKK